MNSTAWTVVVATIAVLVAIRAAFRSLREELRAQGRRIDLQGEDLRRHIEAQGDDLRSAIDARGGRDARKQHPRSPAPISRRLEPLGAAAVQREQAAHLQGLVEGRRLRAALVSAVAAAVAPSRPEEGAGPAEMARRDEKAARVIRVNRFRPPPA